MNKFRWRFLHGCVALLIGMLVWVQVVPAWAADLPLPASAALVDASEALDRYEIEAVFDPAQSTLQCVQRVWYRNRSAEVQPNLYFHAYANAFKREETAPAADETLIAKTYPRGFDPGEIAFSSVKVEGMEAAFALLGADETTLRVPVGMLAPGAQVALEFVYTVRIPLCNYRFGNGNGIWSVGNVFPIAAMPEAGGTWRMDPYISIGDPFYSDCAQYTVTLDAPQNYAVAASGALRAEQTEDGRTRRMWEALAVRDFALVMSDRFKVAQEPVDGIQVLAYATTQTRAADALQYAVAALRTLNGLFAPYPYPSFSVAEVELGGYGGMEYPGMVMLDTAQFLSKDSLEYVTVHETAHQWWYAQVGNDEVREPWLDEALTEYATLLYYEQVYGEERFRMLYENQVETAMRLTLPSDRTIASGIDGFSSLSEYSIVIYNRGAGMLHGLREAVGKETFLEILRAYLQEFRYGIATRADFIRVCNEVTGSDWQGYFDDYLDGNF